MNELVRSLPSNTNFVSAIQTPGEKEAMLTNTVANKSKKGAGKGVGDAAKIIMEKGAAVDLQVVNPFKSVVDYLGLFGGDK